MRLMSTWWSMQKDSCKKNERHRRGEASDDVEEGDWEIRVWRWSWSEMRPDPYRDIRKSRGPLFTTFSISISIPPLCLQIELVIIITCNTLFLLINYNTVVCLAVLNNFVRTNSIVLEWYIFKQHRKYCDFYF